MIIGVVAAGQSLYARSPAVEIFLWSRAAIWLGAILAFLLFVPNRHPRVAEWDEPRLTRDLGFVTDVWARWDSVWFLRIAEDGYARTEEAAAAFYPLYPALVAVLEPVLLGHAVLAGILVSLAACLASFVLLHRLAEPRLGRDGAGRAVLYLALFPTALFLQAVYSESLFLALALAAFLLAERGRFAWAGGAAGLAMLTRPVGIALLPALALLAWRRDPGRLPHLLAAPAVFAAYPLYLWWKLGDPWAFARAQDFWNRHLSWAGPLGGVWDGLRAGWAGARQLASGSDETVYWTAVMDADPDRVAMLNLQALVFLILLVSLTIYSWRLFGAPFGLFAAIGLAIPLSVPSERWPLLSLPRFGLVLFPVFLALAVAGARPRAHAAIVGVSALMLGVAVAQWATWQWVA
jgi:hypothetical protein